jgi:hypothetical protein
MFSTSKFLAAGITAIVLSAFLLASGVLRPSGMEAPGAASSASPDVGPSQPVGWTTERVALTADDFRLDVNDLEFGVDVSPQLNSDPGGSDYWTLEVTWFEHDVEQRINMYFGSDGSDWWVDEIRTYDGYDPGEWVYAYGPFFRTPLGQAFEGDVQVELLGVGRPDDRENLVPAVLSFAGMRLAVSPGSEPILTTPEVTSASPTAAEERRAKKDGAVEKALFAAFRQPKTGPAICRTVEEAQALAEEVLAEQRATGWTVKMGSGIWNEGCGTIGIGEDREVLVIKGMQPDVRDVLEGFFEYSMRECLDEATAVETLTTRLNEIGHTDFVVEVSDMLGGPSDMQDEIQAHADAGCVFYVGAGADADGIPVYELHGD